MTLTDLIDDRHWPLYKAIVSTDLVEQLDANVRATTVPSPMVADQKHRLLIIGEVTLDCDFRDNKFLLNAVVAEGVGLLLIGQPGLEKMGVINCGAKTLTFPYGVVYNGRLAIS